MTTNILLLAILPIIVGITLISDSLIYFIVIPKSFREKRNLFLFPFSGWRLLFLYRKSLRHQKDQKQGLLRYNKLNPSRISLLGQRITCAFCALFSKQFIFIKIDAVPDEKIPDQVYIKIAARRHGVTNEFSTIILSHVSKQINDIDRHNKSVDDLVENLKNSPTHLN